MSAGLQLAQIPGFLPQPASALAAGQGINGLSLSRIQMNADFAATSFEIYYSELSDGDTLQLPVSPQSGDQWLPSDVINHWEYRSTVRDVGGIPAAKGGLLILNTWIDPYSLAVSNGESYMVQGGDTNPTNDGRLSCWSIRQRGRGYLANAGYTPAYSYIADSAFASSPALTQGLLQQLNDNAMAAASRCEAFTDTGDGTPWQAGVAVTSGAVVKPTVYHANGCSYTALLNGTTGDVEPGWPTQIGTIFYDGSVLWNCTGRGFTNGQTFALPTSWDGHAYTAGEFVGGLCSWITTGAPNLTGPSGAGRIQRLQKSINSSRQVSTAVTYWDGNYQSFTTDGVVHVVAFFQRAVAAQPIQPPAYNVMTGEEFMSGEAATSALLIDLNQNVNNAIARPTAFLRGSVASGTAPTLPTDPVILYSYLRSECFSLYALDDTGSIAAGKDMALRLFQTTLDPASGLVTLRTDYNQGGGQITTANGSLDVMTLAARDSYVLLDGLAILNLAGSPGITPPGGGNIIPNGNFQTWNALLKTTSQVVAVPASWSENNNTQDGYNTQRPGNIGPYAVGLDIGTAHGAANTQYISDLSWPVGVASGNLYFWQIWAQSSPAISTGFRVRIHFRDINYANDVYFDVIPLQGLGTSWTKFSGQFTIPQAGDTTVVATGGNVSLSGVAPAQLTYIYVELWNYKPNVSSTVIFGLVDIENQTPSASLTASAANIVDVNGNAINPLQAGPTTITVNPFYYQSGGLLIPCLQGSPYTISGLANNTKYLIYFSDPQLRGGAITPLWTTNFNIAQSQPGIIPIGTVTTTAPGAGGGSVTYRPTSYTDIGNCTTLNPANAYDANPATYAEADGIYAPPKHADCKWSGIPDWPSTPTSPTLVIYSAHTTNLATAILQYFDGTTWTNIYNQSATWNDMSTPHSVPLSPSVHWNEVVVEAITAVPGAMGTDIIEVGEIYISATL